MVPRNLLRGCSFGRGEKRSLVVLSLMHTWQWYFSLSPKRAALPRHGVDYHGMYGCLMDMHGMIKETREWKKGNDVDALLYLLKDWWSRGELLCPRCSVNLKCLPSTVRRYFGMGFVEHVGEEYLCLIPGPVFQLFTMDDICRIFI